jgi:hypothetical protein
MLKNVSTGCKAQCLRYSVPCCHRR